MLIIVFNFKCILSFCQKVSQNVKTVIYYICSTTKQIEGRQMIWSCYLVFCGRSGLSRQLQTSNHQVHIISLQNLIFIGTEAEAEADKVEFRKDPKDKNKIEFKSDLSRQLPANQFNLSQVSFLFYAFILMVTQFSSRAVFASLRT